MLSSTSLSTDMRPIESYARRQGRRDECASGRSRKRSSTAQRISLLTPEALGSFHSIAIHRRDGAALQTLCVGSQRRRRRIGDRSVMASERDPERVSLLLVLLMICVYEATHAAFDLGESQQKSHLIRVREILTAAICLPQP